MKKYISLLLVAVLLLGLVSCGSKYKPQPSTEEEKRVVMTLRLDGEKYDVKYELYRALFLMYKSEIDGGDASVWSGGEKAQYIDKINQRIISSASEIYSAFHLCDKLGINVFSSKYDKMVDEYIDHNVQEIIYHAMLEGEEINEKEGYRRYLEGLGESYFNYEAHVLIYRYQLALAAIDEYYLGSFDPEAPNPYDKAGDLEYTRADVEAFYNSEHSVRLLEAVVKSTEARANEIRERLSAVAAEGDIDRLAREIAGNSMAAPDEIKNGIIIGDAPLDEGFADYQRVAFEMASGTLSSVITVRGGDETAYYIIYKLEKSAEHLEECYADVERAYCENEVARIVSEIKAGLSAGAQLTDKYSAIIHADIKM